MKTLVSALLVSCALAAPFSAFAQSTGDAPFTRAAVQADLVRVEQAGFQPDGSQINYPANIQHAEAIVAQENAHTLATGAGSAATPTSAGTPLHATSITGPQSIYFGD